MKVRKKAQEVCVFQSPRARSPVWQQLIHRQENVSNKSDLFIGRLKYMLSKSYNTCLYSRANKVVYLFFCGNKTDAFGTHLLPFNNLAFPSITPAFVLVELRVWPPAIVPATLWAVNAKILVYDVLGTSYEISGGVNYSIAPLRRPSQTLCVILELCAMAQQNTVSRMAHGIPRKKKTIRLSS